MTTDRMGSERSRFQRRTLWVAVALIGVAVVLWLAFRLRTVVFMVFVSVFLAVALAPPVQYLSKRGWRRGAATGVVFLVALMGLIGFIWALAPLFIDQINQLIDSVPIYVENLATWAEETFGFDLSEFDLEAAGEEFPQAVRSVSGALVGGVIGITAGIGGFLFFATTVGLFTFYMVAELPQLQRTVLSLMPGEEQRRALHIWEVAVEKMGGYIYSRLLLAVVSAAISAAFLSFLDVPFALSLGIWVGVLSQFIPVIGTYLAAILPAVVALSSRGATTMLWVVLFFVGYQQIENYVFSPRITKRTMEIHPAVSVAAIIIGGNLLGGIGVIVALPVTGIIQALISETRRRHDVVLDEAPEVGDSPPEE